MKILSLYFTIVSALCITFCVNGHKIDSHTRQFLNTLKPILDIDVNSPFNLAFGAVLNINDTLKTYEDVFNKSTDECLRGCYAYCIHMLEISYNLQCNSKFHAINEEYKSNKPCYKANQDMQNILDHGNAYLDLFCARDDKDACPFVTEIVKMQNDTTVLQKSCGADQKNRTKCDETLINNYSVMIDAGLKLKTKNVTYSSGGQTITLTTPQYDLTKIEEVMKNKTCIVDIQPPQQILVNDKPAKKNNSKNNKTNETSEALLGQKMNMILAFVSVVLTALLF